MTVVQRLISGGQTGADRGGLDAAIELGMPHGGWCPKGRRAEDGRIPAKYQLMETAGSSYPERTEKNVVDSDATVVFTFGEPGGGSALTVDLARKHAKPVLHVDLAALMTDDHSASDLRDWIEQHRVEILNVAGSRESNAPGIGERVRAIVVAALRGPDRPPSSAE